MSERSHAGPHPVTAAALRDERGDGAAVVSAAAHGELAERIIALAEEAGVPLYEDPALARLLAQMDLGEQIPTGLYHAVAEVIAFVWSLDAAESSPPASS